MAIPGAGYGAHAQLCWRRWSRAYLTNIPLHRELMVDAKFMAGGTNIHYLEVDGAASAISAGWTLMMPGDQATVELRLMAAQQWVEPLGDALLELGALSISVEDADAQTDAEQTCLVSLAWTCPYKAGSAQTVRPVP